MRKVVCMVSGLGAAALLGVAVAFCATGEKFNIMLTLGGCIVLSLISINTAPKE